jgi:hypothetical protein
LIALINKAELIIQMQIYIYEDDTTGLMVADALMNASK